MKKPKKPVKREPKKKPPKLLPFNQHTIRTDYLDAIYRPEFLKNIPKAVKIVRAFKRRHPFDAIAFSGSSGAGFAFPLSFLMKIPLIHVRKAGDKTHYEGGYIEGTVSSKRYLIVDDVIQSGRTIERIIKLIKKETNNDVEPVGIFLYDSPKTWWDNKLPVITLRK